MGFNSRQSARLEALRERQREAGLVSERYPQVEEITLETVFHDTDGRPVQRRVRHVTADSFALFELRCPIEGALISLNDVVSEVIQRHGRRRSGAIECTGDSDESGIVMPAHSMDYVVRVKYHRAKSSGGRKGTRTRAGSTASRKQSKASRTTSAKKAGAKASKTASPRRAATKTAAKSSAARTVAKRATQAGSKRQAKKKTASASGSRKTQKAVVKVSARSKARKKSVPATRRTTRRRAIA